MTELWNVVKANAPAPARRAWRLCWGAYCQSRQLGAGLAWQLDYRRWRSYFRLRAIKDQHSGERCFIIGNGPSLNKMDLSPLRNEITFGLNRIYLLFPRIGFHTIYYVSVNPLVVEQCAHEIASLQMPKFIGWDARNAIEFTPDMMLVRDPYDSHLGFSKDPTHRIWEGATVTYTAMQLAYYFGFRQVILIGVDHNFVTQGKAHQEVTSDGPDPNHFDPSYFGKGFRWNLPDLERSEQAYRLAKQHFERSGREILDATVGGHLQVFTKVNYRTFFE